MVMVVMIMVIMMMVMMVLDDGFGLGWPNSIQLSTKLPRSKFTALAPQSQSIPKFLIPGSDPSLVPISQTDRFIQVGRLTKKGTLMHHAVNVLLHKEPDESEPHPTLRCGRNTFLMLLKIFFWIFRHQLCVGYLKNTFLSDQFRDDFESLDEV